MSRPIAQLGQNKQIVAKRSRGRHELRNCRSVIAFPTLYHYFDIAKSRCLSIFASSFPRLRQNVYRTYHHIQGWLVRAGRECCENDLVIADTDIYLRKPRAKCNLSLHLAMSTCIPKKTCCISVGGQELQVLRVLMSSTELCFLQMRLSCRIEKRESAAEYSY